MVSATQKIRSTLNPAMAEGHDHDLTELLGMLQDSFGCVDIEIHFMLSERF